ncbi:MAG: cysteine synthase A [Cyanobacteria bacterium REEB65]|nr:cysteine synthase A [Cyanobacteria bacterium REEB65]
MRIFDNPTELIGHTPLLRLHRVVAGCQGELLAKLEGFNPAGSVKDRIGVSMILAAERRAEIAPGRTVIIEPTSGNTGIALAFVAAARGYKLILTMPETSSMERRTLLLSLGAEVHLVPGGPQAMLEAIALANEIARRTPGAWIPQQFENPDNPRIHSDTTAEEIWEDTGGSVDVIVTGVGTGGTLTGCYRQLYPRKPSLRFIAVEPAESAVLSTGERGPHKIQGIGTGFIPHNLDPTLLAGLLDGSLGSVMTVGSEDAMAFARRLACEEGVHVGISSGAAAYCAVEFARLPQAAGKRIVAIFPDRGERYLSTGLFAQAREQAEQLPIESPRSTATP